MARVMQHTQLPRWQVLLLVAVALAAVLAAPRICHLTCGQAHSAGGSSGSGSSEAGGSASSAPTACGSGQPGHRPFAFVTLLASRGQDGSQQGLEADGYFQSVRLLNYRLTRNPATRTRLPGAQFAVLVAPQVGGRAGVWGEVRWVVLVGGCVGRGNMRVALKYEGCADAPAKQRAPHAGCGVLLSSYLCSAAALRTWGASTPVRCPAPPRQVLELKKDILRREGALVLEVDVGALTPRGVRPPPGYERWADGFAKLLPWNLTQYSGVAVLDGEAQRRDVRRCAWQCGCHERRMLAVP